MRYWYSKRMSFIRRLYYRIEDFFRLPTIPVRLFVPQKGWMQARIFANHHAGIKPTLFYDIEIPLEPFNSGLNSVSESTTTGFRLNFIRFPLTDWRQFDGRVFEVNRF